MCGGYEINNLIKYTESLNRIKPFCNCVKKNLDEAIKAPAQYLTKPVYPYFGHEQLKVRKAVILYRQNSMDECIR